MNPHKPMSELWWVPLKEILKLTPHQPLFGHPSGKAQLTHWLCFMKPNATLSNLEGRDGDSN